MSENTIEEVLDETNLVIAAAHRDLYTKYTFYLLAVDGAAVGFALTQTQGVVLAWSQMPLGTRDGQLVDEFLPASMSRRMELKASVATTLFSLAKTKSKVVDSPVIGEVFRSELRRAAKWATRYNEWQITTLLIGLSFYLGWHVLEMYLRQPLTS